MVGAARGGVNESAGNAGDQEGIIDLEFDGVFEGLLLFGQHLVEAFGLGYSAREAVQYEAGGKEESVSTNCARAKRAGKVPI